MNQDYVKGLFTYDPSDPQRPLVRRMKRYPKETIGERVGVVKPDGYVEVKIDRRPYKLHRIVYLYFEGELPAYIDHVDGNPSNNKMSNLRAATAPQNGANRRISNNNTSGYKGVHAVKGGGFTARLTHRGKRIYLGTYNTAAEAADAYNQKTNELNGEYAKLNQICDLPDNGEDE